jgi:hypothetical protein
MTAHVRNMELSFEDIVEAVSKMPSKDQIRLFEKTMPTHLLEILPLSSSNIIQLRDDIPIQEYLDFITKNRKPIDWEKIDNIAKTFNDENENDDWFDDYLLEERRESLHRNRHELSWNDIMKMSKEEIYSEYDRTHDMLKAPQ